MKSEKKKLSRKTVTIFLILGLALSGSHANAAGRSAKSVANTILNGKGAPKISLGIDGDFYIDTRSLLIYGPKKKGRWPLPTNLQGPTGPIGNPGKSGNDGKTISSASTTSGPQGPAGPVGPKGEAGSPGAPGSSGPTGPAGQDGSPGLPGASGPAGSPGGSGPAGPAGSGGATGVTGATGAQGPAGLTTIIFGTLEFNDFSAASTSAQAITLRGFKARTSYVVRVRIFLHQPLDITEYFLPMALSASAPIGSPVVHIGYVLSHGYSFRENLGRYENSILAEIVLDGKAMESEFEIAITVTVGRNTSGNGSAKARGDFTAMEVTNTQNYA